MGHIVAKFGGTSLATPESLRRVIDIINADPERTHIVVSAPGRRLAGDEKVTDLLLALGSTEASARRTMLDRVWERYSALADSFDYPAASAMLTREFIQLSYELASDEPQSADFWASRGEYLMGRLLAEILGWPFANPSDFIRLTKHGHYDEAATRDAYGTYVLPERAVIPGFYGRGPEGHIRTFSRNGSDITGSIVAALTGAKAYENWTDTNGVLSGDPRIVPHARTIESMTRAELLELAYRGSPVLHGEALAPLRGTHIPVFVRNTFAEGPGTCVVASKESLARPVQSAIAVTSRAGFSQLTLEKSGMSGEVGFLARLMTAFADLGINIVVMPSGIETQSVIFADTELDNRDAELEERVKETCAPEKYLLERRSLALICVVGETMAHHHGVAAKVFTALANAQVNVRTIDQGATEISIVIGIDPSDEHSAVRAIYDTF
jgi:aspartate kinase